MNTTFEAIANSLFNNDRAHARINCGDNRDSLASDNYVADDEEVTELSFEF